MCVFLNRKLSRERERKKKQVNKILIESKKKIIIIKEKTLRILMDLVAGESRIWLPEMGMVADKVFEVIKR